MSAIERFHCICLRWLVVSFKGLSPLHSSKVIVRCPFTCFKWETFYSIWVCTLDWPHTNTLTFNDIFMNPGKFHLLNQSCFMHKLSFTTCSSMQKGGLTASSISLLWKMLNSNYVKIRLFSDFPILYFKWYYSNISLTLHLMILTELYSYCY